MTPLLVSVEEAAAALGIGRSKAYELIASGQLPFMRIGRRTLVPTKALSEWVDRLASATRLAIAAPESPEGAHKAGLTNELGNPCGCSGLLFALPIQEDGTAS